MPQAARLDGPVIATFGGRLTNHFRDPALRQLGDPCVRAHVEGEDAAGAQVKPVARW
jgi:hypothetical protein